MKDYPSIDPSSAAPIGQYCYAFHKYDGSNLRFEWSKKAGWHIQGTRRRLFDKNDPDFGCAIELFEKKYGESLVKAVVDFKDFKKPQGFVAFAEFLGPHSFAGWHAVPDLNSIGIKVDHNDPKDVVLFDVNINKRGFVGPKNFIKAFGHLHTPELLHQGFITEEFIFDVRQGKYGEGEGVVCKGGDGFSHDMWMCKIKTLTYLQLLRERFGVGGAEKYWE